MNELDQSAWERWVAFRKAIRKPIKPASEHAMKLKLARYGAQQEAVVNQSIENQWQGLFDLKVAKPAPGDKPVKTDKQIAADNERVAALESRSESNWSRHMLGEDLGRLKLCDALLARYTLRQDEIGHAERMDWLRGRAAEALREVGAGLVVNEPSLLSMIRSLWGEKGVYRIKARAETERVQKQPDVVANMADAVHP